jgi:hypothetical protein
MVTFSTVTASTMPLIVIPFASVVTIFGNDYGDFRFLIPIAVTVPVAVTISIPVPFSAFSAFASFAAAFAALAFIIS